MMSRNMLDSTRRWRIASPLVGDVTGYYDFGAPCVTCRKQIPVFRHIGRAPAIVKANASIQVTCPICHARSVHVTEDLTAFRKP
jgi:hypothetical protein